MKNKFLNISIGISLMIFATGFLIRSISPANAAPAPEAFLDEGTTKIGKYMMSLSTHSNERLIVWDTENGESTYYEHLAPAYGKPGKWIKSEGQIPNAFGK